MTTRKVSPASIDIVLAFKLWVLILKLSIAGQQCLYAPRVKGVDSPRLLHSSRSYCFNLRMVDVYPSNCPLAGSALSLFKSWLSILWLFLYFGQQCCKFIRVITSFVQTIRTVIASNLGLQSPGYPGFRANSASNSIREQLLALWIQLPAYAYTQCPNFGGNIPIWMSYVKYEDKSMVGNTSWPGIRIKRALSRNFPYLRYKVLHRWTHRVPHIELGFDLISPYAARVKVAPAHADSSRGTRIWVS
jgi:hypothetical protein